MFDLLADLERGLAEGERAWLREGLARCEREGARALTVLWPALPRRVGRQVVGSTKQQVGAAQVDLAVWRACDVAAWAALSRGRADDAAVLELFAHGDIEERTMVLRATTARPLTPLTGRLFGEIQRSNTLPHFEALACDCDLVARACDQVEGFGRDQLNRLLLKAAFIGVRLVRFFGVERHANPELSRMLQDLATEREAAGRAVWPDTGSLIARAPAPGTMARLIGDLEHGDDARRLAAGVGLGILGRRELLPFVRERLPREPSPAIAQALRDAATKLS